MRHAQGARLVGFFATFALVAVSILSSSGCTNRTPAKPDNKNASPTMAVPAATPTSETAKPQEPAPTDPKAPKTK